MGCVREINILSSCPIGARVAKTPLLLERSDAGEFVEAAIVRCKGRRFGVSAKRLVIQQV